MKQSQLVLILGLSAAMLGCAKEQHAQPFTATYNAETTMEAVQVQLAESAKSISRSLLTLAEIEKTTQARGKLPAPLDANRIGMAERASVDWTGPIEPLVRKIAEASKYQIKVLGKDPAIPIVVQINAQNKPLADILRNAHFQAGNEADIIVYPKSRTIELRYLTE